jgi:predicted transcriptional regulator
VLKIWQVDRRRVRVLDAGERKGEAMTRVEEGGEELSRRERQILEIIYARGEASALEVHAAMADAPSTTAVRTLLRILEAKGHIKHRVEGMRYIYRPSRPRGRAGRSALRRVLRTFFDGSLEKAVAAHLGDPAADLSGEELERLAAIIREAQQGRKS